MAKTDPRPEMSLRAATILRAARRLWWPAFLASVALTLASLPGYFTVFHTGFTPSPDFALLQEVAAWIAMFFSLGAACLLLALALLIYRKLPADPLALALSYFLVITGVFGSGPIEQFLTYWAPQYNNLILYLQGIYGPPIAILLILTFPNGRFIPPWSRWLLAPTLFWTVVMQVTISPNEIVRMNSVSAIVSYAIIGVIIFISVFIQVYRYRRVYSQVERQQTKIVLVGGLVALILMIVSSIPYYYMQNLPPGTPLPWWMPLGSAAWGTMLLIFPLSLTLAILRYRLFDIDLIFRRTLVYSSLTFLLGGLYFGSVLLLQNLFQVVIGHNEPSAVTVISTLGIAAVFSPLRHKLQESIDRRFYRQRYDAEQTLQEFAASLRDEVDLEQLSESLVSVVRETMQPEKVGLWLKASNDRR